VSEEVASEWDGQTLEVTIAGGDGQPLDHAEFWNWRWPTSWRWRQERLIARGLKAAGVREQKTLGRLQLGLQPLDQKEANLRSGVGRFVRQHRDVLLAGPPGVGKSHLVQAIGRQLVHAGFTLLYRSSSTRCETSCTMKPSRGMDG